nr:MAG TPA: hypothetical protein [Caudoviricetes sp.]
MRVQVQVGLYKNEGKDVSRKEYAKRVKSELREHAWSLRSKRQE